MYTRALQGDLQSPCWKSSVSFTFCLQFCQAVWRIKLQLPLNATRCRQGPATCFWWQTVRCNGGSEGWILFLHPTIYRQKWPGAATHLLGCIIFFFYFQCAVQQLTPLRELTCEIDVRCLLGLSRLTLSPQLLMIHYGVFFCVSHYKAKTCGTAAVGEHRTGDGFPSTGSREAGKVQSWCEMKTKNR